MTIQTADPYSPDTELRAERDKAAGMAVATLLLTAGRRSIRITVWRDYAADAAVRASVADRVLAEDMAERLGLREVHVEGGRRWAGTVSGAPVQIVTH